MYRDIPTSSLLMLVSPPAPGRALSTGVWRLVSLAVGPPRCRVVDLDGQLHMLGRDRCCLCTRSRP